MPKVKKIEKRIRNMEGFDVQIIKEDGRDVRSDKKLPKQYRAGRAAKNSYTVNEWITKRFQKQFPGLNANVLDGDGKKVRGNTTLGTVRATYNGSRKIPTCETVHIADGSMFETFFEHEKNRGDEVGLEQDEGLLREVCEAMS